MHTGRESCILSIIILPENTGTDGLGLFLIFLNFKGSLCFKGVVVI